jgi:hypothetical protein
MGVADLALSVGALRLSVGGLLTGEAASPLGSGTAEASLIAGRAMVCLGTEKESFEGCAGVAAGAVSASGRDYFDEGSTTLGMVAPFARLAARYPKEGLLAVRIALDGLLHVMRPELRVEGQGGAEDSGSLVGAAASVELVLSIR